MTDDAQTLVDRLAAGLPRTSPDAAALVASGRVARRRRRRTTMVGAAVLALVIVAGGVLVPRLLRGDSPAEPAAEATRSVGANGYAIVVPASWPTVREDCFVSQPVFVYFTTGLTPNSRCPLVGNTNVVSFVAIGRPSDQRSFFVPEGRQRTAGDGLQETPVSCRVVGGDPSCFQSVWSIDADVSFTINLPGRDARAGVERVRDSVRVLSPEEVAVPFVADVADGTVGSDVGDLAASGLVARVVGGAAGGGPGVLLDADRAPGDVVRRGSAVTFTVSDVAGPAEHGDLTEQEFLVAAAAARSLPETVTRAVATVEDGTLDGTGGRPGCGSGRLLRIMAYGRFPDPDYTGGLPNPGPALPDRRLVVADPATGIVCDVSPVRIATPVAGATIRFPTDDSSPPRSH